MTTYLQFINRIFAKDATDDVTARSEVNIRNCEQLEDMFSICTTQKD